MEPRTCERCGSPFTPRGGGGRPQKYCSPPCRKAAAQKAWRLRQRTDWPTTCAECGTALPPSERRRRFCSDDCRRRSNNRRYNRSRLPLKNPTEKVCAYCGDTFTAKSRDRIYCYGKHCAQYAYQKRKREGVPLRVGGHEVTCGECGETFTSTRPEARWCSKRCANRHWGRIRSRQRRAPSEAKYTDREIFERDGWVCQICGEPVNRDVDRKHPDGATIDHVTPIAAGGFDEPSNLVTAHWRCNHEKGSKT